MTEQEVLDEIRDVVDFSWLPEAGRYRQIEAIIDQFYRETKEPPRAG